MKIPELELIFMKIIIKYIQNFDETLLNLSNILSQFLLYELRFFTSKTYANFVTMNHFLLDF